MPSRLATPAATALRSLSAVIANCSVGRSILRGRPPSRPRARAAASPARVRSVISSRSNSANAADAKREPAGGGRCVDLRVGTGKHLQADPARAKVLGGDDQVAKVAAEPIELPDHQGVARLERLEAGDQSRAGIVAPGCEILIDAARVDAGREQRVALRLQNLCAIGF